MPPLPTVIEAKQAAVELCSTMRRIHRRGWCDGTGGNFSCRLRRDPLELLMAPSGVDKGSLRPGDLIVVDGGGEVLRGKGRASAETLLHIALMEHAQAGAVLHSHSQAGTLLSRLALGRRDPSPTEGEVVCIEHAGLEMLKGLEGIRSHECRVRVPVLANDQDIGRLAQAARPLLPDCPWGFLVAGHGLYAWGTDLTSARRHLEIHEFLLEQHWRTLLLQGGSPLVSTGPWEHRL